MQEDLPEIVRQLRKEACPQRVIDAVSRRIAAKTPRPNRLRYAIPAAFAGVALLCGLLVRWQPAGGNPPRQPESVDQQAQVSKQVAREAQSALDLFGTVLLNAGARSETVISDHAVPPLRHGFETARNKIIQEL